MKSLGQQAAEMFLYLQAAKRRDPSLKSIRREGNEYVISSNLEELAETAVFPAIPSESAPYTAPLG